MIEYAVKKEIGYKSETTGRCEKEIHEQAQMETFGMTLLLEFKGRSVCINCYQESDKNRIYVCHIKIYDHLYMCRQKEMQVCIYSLFVEDILILSPL